MGYNQSMRYRVFLVEDEIVTREGIRDNLDWSALGFDFCGEAPNGEIALPLIRSSQPDILITDIKMPFMDGLQLTRLVRELLPNCKIIILSGHDEFRFAQEAIKLGVTEYMLKPISIKELTDILFKVARQIEKERTERTRTAGLEQQAKGSRDILREKFLVQLIVGGLAVREAIKKSKELKIDLVAAWYQVVVIRVEPDCDMLTPLDYGEYDRIEALIAGLVQDSREILMVRKDIDEAVLILKGETPDQMTASACILAGLVQEEVHRRIPCSVQAGIGDPCQRITEIATSYQLGLERSQDITRPLPIACGMIDESALVLPKIEREAVDRFLNYGLKSEFPAFFNEYIRPLSRTALEDRVFLNYVLIDLILSAASLVVDLGGDLDTDFPPTRGVKRLLQEVDSIDKLEEVVRRILFIALDFRDKPAANQSTLLVHKARQFIYERYTDPNLSLEIVANHINVSPGYFSQLFSYKNDETFIEFVTRLRIEKAKELLRTTDLRSLEIAERVGYNDAHYFSTVFKKHAGQPPSVYRAQALAVRQHLGER